jgi:two-component system, LytTR family, response regulator
MTIRTLIVDDEPLARTRLRSLLEREPDVTVVGECGDGRRAVALVDELEPDLLFLDVQMPVLDGFGVLEALDPDRMPAVIFVTAYDRYAIRAFDVHALDYLLKPFDRDRFQRALARARSQIAANEKAQVLPHYGPSQRRPLQRLVIKSLERVFFLRLEEIDWIEAAGNYVKLHVGAETYLRRETMTALEDRLNTDQFVRVHRSTIVNLDRIQELQAWFHGDYKVILHDGTQLTLSRGYREKLQEQLGCSF